VSAYVDTLPALVPGGLSCPVPLAVALMQFTTADPTRVHMSGLGMDAGRLSATDGLTGARVHGLAKGDTHPLQDTHDGAWWPGAVVKEAIGIARASKKPAIFLAWSECGTTDMRYPPLAQCMAFMHGKPTGTIGIDATLLARLQKVCEAIQGRRLKDCSAHAVKFSFGDDCDPVIAFVQGKALAVEVVIMPVRL
jgi:hypothetical protein